MKICKLMLTVVMCACILSSCAKHDHAATPTGVPRGEIWQPQLMYDDVIYYYFATGFNEPLPEGYELVGSVESVDNRNLPTENFEAVRMSVGQEIYACESEEAIFIQFTNGYARFETDEERDEWWEANVKRMKERLESETQTE